MSGDSLFLNTHPPLPPKNPDYGYQKIGAPESSKEPFQGQEEAAGERTKQCSYSCAAFAAASTAAAIFECIL